MPNKIPVYKAKINESDATGVNLVSFVEYPAIEENWVALSKENEQVTLAKDTYKQVLTGAVLVPDKEIYRVDKHGNPYYIVYDAETIEQVSQKFFKQNYTHNTNDEHLIALDKNYVIESWIKTSEQDKSVALGMDLPIGTWLMSYKVEDSEYWNEQILTNKKRGFSIEGLFSMEEVELKNSKLKMNKKSKNILQKLKEFITKVSLSDYELEDGRTLTIDDESFEAFIDSEVAPDGDYITTDGETITVSDGIVEDAENLDLSKTKEVTTEPEVKLECEQYITRYTTTDGKLIDMQYVSTANYSDGAVVEDGIFSTLNNVDIMVKDGKVIKMNYLDYDSEQYYSTHKTELQNLKIELAETKEKLKAKELEYTELASAPASTSITKEVQLTTNVNKTKGQLMVENLKKAQNILN
jgi:hypothetical protein